MQRTLNAMKYLLVVLLITGCTTTQLQGHGVCHFTKDAVKFGGFEWREATTLKYDIAYPTERLPPYSMKDYFLFEAGELKYGESSASDTEEVLDELKKEIEE